MAREEGDGGDGMQAGAGHEDRISSAIRQVYDNVANEPLPDKLNALLEQLRQGGKE